MLWGACTQRLLIRFELLPGDVPRVGIGQEDLPFVAGKSSIPRLPGGADLALPGPPVDVRSRVARIVQDGEHTVTLQLAEDERSCTRSFDDSPRPDELLLPEVAHHGARRARAAERVEHEADGALHLVVGIEHELSTGVENHTQRGADPQLAAARLVELPPDQTRAQHMQLRLRHRTLETEQKSVIEVGRVVEPVFVQNERFAQRADLQQAMPVAGVTGESRDLQPHDHADATEADVGDDALKADPLDRRRARQPQVVIDDHDLVGRPAERQGPPLQGVLPGRALLMVVHLLQGRLPHVETGERRRWSAVTAVD